jgi:multiple sugar transport system substrate-binding protein
MHQDFDREGVYEEFYRLCAGKTTRSGFMKRAAQLGLSATAIGAFVKAYNPVTARADIEASEATRPASASGVASLGFYSWILDFNPQIKPLTDEYNKKNPNNKVAIQVAPTTNFSDQKFLLQARSKTSSWDAYIGMTPFVEMAQLQAAGAIEPWDPYMPAHVKNDMPKSVQDEGMIDGKMYDWPMLLDITSLQWRKSMYKAAGITAPPTTWEQFDTVAKKLSAAKLNKGTVAGATFDWHPWRSVMPVVHSISLDAYTSDGLPDFTKPVYAQALNILKSIMPYTPKDFFSTGTAVEAGTIDEIAMKASRVAMIFKYANTTVHAASLWKGYGINDMGLAKLPKPAAGGAGGSVFWDTGAGLFTYGKNKQSVANWLTFLLGDTRFWTKEVVSSGQIPPFKSMYPKIKGKVPGWIYPAYSQLAASKAIPNSIYGFSLGLNGVLVTPFLNFLKGQTTAEEALSKANSDFQTQLQTQGG